MEVRRFEDRADVREIIRIDAMAWRAAYDDLLPEEVLDAKPVDPTEDDIDRWLEGGLRANREGILVAETEEGHVRGYADFRWGEGETKAFVEEGEAGLKAIHVHPDHWGEGIGTALLEQGLAILPEWVEAVRLEMFADNDIARPFYEARGFDQTGSGAYEIHGEAYPTAIYTLQL